MVLWLAICALLVSTPMLAQDRTATISGIITGSPGVVIANAAVQAHNVTTGDVYDVATSTGRYTLTGLPAGHYEISVTAPGFKIFTRQDIIVKAAQNVRIDIPLEEPFIFDHKISLSQIIQVCAFVSALVLAVFAYRQLRIQTRAHLLEAFRQVFKMIDDIRPDRHYVRSIDRTKTFMDEQWLDPNCGGKGDWNENRSRAEKVFRTFDQLGLLVRERRLPLNLIAPFCVVPIIEAWYALWPYILEVRKQRGQLSHGWHFQYLVYEVVLPGLDRNRGVWRGIRAFDFPESTKSSEKLTVVKDNKPAADQTTPGLPGRPHPWVLRRIG